MRSSWDRQPVQNLPLCCCCPGFIGGPCLPSYHPPCPCFAVVRPRIHLQSPLGPRHLIASPAPAANEASVQYDTTLRLSKLHGLASVSGLGCPQSRPYPHPFDPPFPTAAAARTSSSGPPHHPAFNLPFDSPHTPSRSPALAPSTRTAFDQPLHAAASCPGLDTGQAQDCAHSCLGLRWLSAARGILDRAAPLFNSLPFAFGGGANESHTCILIDNDKNLRRFGEELNEILLRGEATASNG